MASYNKVILMGNLTRDPELKYTPDGLAICSFDIAVNTRTGRGQGEAREETLFIRISTFAKQAENCGQYLAKGRPVLVDGRLKTDSWQADDGSKRYRTEVVANQVTFLPRANEGGGSGFSQAPQQDSGSKKVDIGSIDEISDDDIPF